MLEPRPPRTADGDAFRFRSGRLSLDLCSTLLWRHRAATEQLRAPLDLVRWLREAGVEPAPRAASDGDLHQARELREAIYGLVHDRLAGRALAEPHVATINALAARADPVPRLTGVGEIGYGADEPAAAALSRIARDAIDVLAGPSAARVRECAAPDCAFLFLDTSRAGRRRWCAMDRCGNREHVRKHRRRQRLDPLPRDGEVAP
jgi:predicted RNA-binding Zn ribbon-like protein